MNASSYERSVLCLRRSYGFAAVISLLVAACSSEPAPASSDAAVDAAPTMLEEVAAIVIPNCAIGGCHDSVSETHSMDLSTPEKIANFWIGQPGFDHCTHSEVPRVIPGDPDASLVVIKISGVAVCSQSQRMPLPPKNMLAASQIETIRRWIAAGAPRGTVSGDAGSDVSDASTSKDSADATEELSICSNSDASDGPPPIYTPDADDTAACSAAQLCSNDTVCIGDSCETRWQCVAHSEHPCPTEIVPYCGCDGVTFLAPNTCPDRPFQYARACDEGTNCDPTDITCSDPPPSCPEGMVPSVVRGRYGACVPFASCSCEYAWECPQSTKYVCDYVARHCVPVPTD